MKTTLAGVLMIAFNIYGSAAQQSAQILKSEPVASANLIEVGLNKNVRSASACMLLQQTPVRPDTSKEAAIAPAETLKEIKISTVATVPDSVKGKPAETANVKNSPVDDATAISATPKSEKQSTASPASPASFAAPSVASGHIIQVKSTGKTALASPALTLGTAKVSVGLASALDGTLNDFSPVPYQHGIVYVSNSHKLKKGVKVGDAEDPEDYNLKFSEFDSTGALTKPANFSRKLNTSKTHEGPVSFTKDGKTMFITRNTAFDDGKKHGKTTSNLKIFIKTMVDGEWTGEETLPFETDHHNYCHPSLSADGTRLYFASDIPGGFGGMDIYMSRRLKDGSWTQPINMGPRVNTDKTELFPYIAENGTLFFSSNGRKGAGGLDIFRIEIESRTARAMNLGEPFNSENDDFGVMFMPGSARKGYFSSNRPGGSGGDDIYQFEIK